MPFGNPLGYMMPQMQQPRTPDEELAEYMRQQQAQMQQLAAQNRQAADRSQLEAFQSSVAAQQPRMNRMTFGSLGPDSVGNPLEEMQAGRRPNTFADLQSDTQAGSPSRSFYDRVLAEQRRGNRVIPPPAELPQRQAFTGPSFAEWAAARGAGGAPSVVGAGLNIAPSSPQASQMRARMLDPEREPVTHAGMMQQRRVAAANERARGMAGGGTGDETGGLGNLLSPQALSFIPPQDRARYVAGIASVLDNSLSRKAEQANALALVKVEAEARGDLDTARFAHEAEMKAKEEATRIQIAKDELAARTAEQEAQRQHNESMLGLRKEEVGLQRDQFEASQDPLNRQAAAEIAGLTPERSDELFGQNPTSGVRVPRVPEGGFVDQSTGGANLDQVEQYVLQADPLSIQPGTIPREQLIALRNKYANIPGLEVFGSSPIRSAAGMVPMTPFAGMASLAEPFRRYMSGEGNSERERQLAMLAKIDQMLQVLDARSGL